MLKKCLEEMGFSCVGEDVVGGDGVILGCLGRHTLVISAVESDRNTCVRRIMLQLGEGIFALGVLGTSEGGVAGGLGCTLAGLFGGEVVLLALEVSSSGSSIVGGRAGGEVVLLALEVSSNGISIVGGRAVEIYGGASGRSAGEGVLTRAVAPGKRHALERKRIW